MNTNHRFSFSKEERLSHKQTIEELFSKGNQVFVHPFKVIYLPKLQPDALPTKVMFSVSKRNFKLATDRNWVKRRLREVYRTHKHLFQTENGLAYLACLGIVYVAKEKVTYSILEKKMVSISKKIDEQYKKEVSTMH